jgi:microcystin-dependent protein
MSSKLPPVQHRTPLLDQNGFLNQNWSDWFQKVFFRLGGTIASTNDEIDIALADIRTHYVPAGIISPYAGTSAPTGYLLCDGSAVSRATYSALFTAISTAHGTGDGSTTFNLPDYRGRFLRGIDGAAARDPNSATRTAMATGGATGNNVGSVQVAATALPTTPMVTDSQGAHSSHWTGTIAAVQTGAGTNTITAPTGPNTLGAHTHTITSGGDSETRPINVYVNWVVKT